MDIVSHAAAGAASGAVFGRPVLGMVCAVIPDVVLGIERVEAPTELYVFTHSLTFAVLMCLTLLIYSSDPHVAFTALLAVGSHLFLDLPTHGNDWAPRLLYPFWKQSFSLGEEWEWFNYSWWRGLCLTIVWSSVCLALS